MPYIADPLDTSKPQDSDMIGFSAEEIRSLKARINALETQLGTDITSAVGAETTARTTAVTNEATLRADADTVLQGNIDSLNTSTNDAITLVATDVDDLTPDVVIGYTSHTKYYLKEAAASFNTGTNTFDNSTTVGPTGSGAEIIMSYLDSIPTTAKFIDIQVGAFMEFDNIEGKAQAEFYVRSVPTTVSYRMQVVQTYITTNNREHTAHSFCRIPIDNTRIFNIGVIVSYGGQSLAQMRLTLIGFGE